jgi:hypothetical protein
MIPSLANSPPSGISRRPSSIVTSMSVFRAKSVGKADPPNGLEIRSSNYVTLEDTAVDTVGREWEVAKAGAGRVGQCVGTPGSTAGSAARPPNPEALRWHPTERSCRWGISEDPARQPQVAPSRIRASLAIGADVAAVRRIARCRRPANCLPPANRNPRPRFRLHAELR